MIHLRTKDCILKDLHEQGDNPDTSNEEAISSDGKFDCMISWLMQHPSNGEQANHYLPKSP